MPHSIVSVPKAGASHNQHHTSNNTHSSHRRHSTVSHSIPFLPSFSLSSSHSHSPPTNTVTPAPVTSSSSTSQSRARSGSLRRSAPLRMGMSRRRSSAAGERPIAVVSRGTNGDVGEERQEGRASAADEAAKASLPPPTATATITPKVSALPNVFEFLDDDESEVDGEMDKDTSESESESESEDDEDEHNSGEEPRQSQQHVQVSAPKRMANTQYHYDAPPSPQSTRSIPRSVHSDSGISISMSDTNSTNGKRTERRRVRGETSSSVSNATTSTVTIVNSASRPESEQLIKRARAATSVASPETRPRRWTQSHEPSNENPSSPESYYRTQTQAIVPTMPAQIPTAIPPHAPMPPSAHPHPQSSAARSEPMPAPVSYRPSWGPGSSVETQVPTQYPFYPPSRSEQSRSERPSSEQQHKTKSVAAVSAAANEKRVVNRPPTPPLTESSSSSSGPPSPTSTSQIPPATTSLLSFRRFENLNIHILTTLQSEISSLENELATLLKEEEEIEKGRPQHARSHDEYGYGYCDTMPELRRRRMDLESLVQRRLRAYNEGLASYMNVLKTEKVSQSSNAVSSFPSVPSSQQETKLSLFPSGMQSHSTATATPTLLNPITFLTCILLLVLSFSDVPKPLSRLVVFGSVGVAVLVLRERGFGGMYAKPGALGKGCETKQLVE